MQAVARVKAAADMRKQKEVGPKGNQDMGKKRRTARGGRKHKQQMQGEQCTFEKGFD